MHRFKLQILALSLIILVNCSEITDHSRSGNLEIKVDESIAVDKIPEGEGPYNYGIPLNLNYKYPADSNGIAIFEYQNKNYYHPVVIGMYIIRFIDSYQMTLNMEYIERAKLFYDKLEEIALNESGTYYFSYNFDWNLHNIRGEDLFAPWYSGMAQGIVLSGLVGLYSSTNEEKYINAADSVFQSFKNFHYEYDTWTVSLDTAGYYWIEEYPMQNQTHVLNGFVSGVYGLYDYYMLKKDDDSFQYLQAALTTLKHYLPDFRRPGKTSYYCLKHEHPGTSHYHQVHTEQLYMLHKMTGDSFFKSMADSFYADYHE